MYNNESGIIVQSKDILEAKGYADHMVVSIVNGLNYSFTEEYMQAMPSKYGIQYMDWKPAWAAIINFSNIPEGSSMPHSFSSKSGLPIYKMEKLSDVTWRTLDESQLNVSPDNPRDDARAIRQEFGDDVHIEPGQAPDGTINGRFL